MAIMDHETSLSLKGLVVGSGIFFSSVQDLLFYKSMLKPSPATSSSSTHLAL